MCISVEKINFVTNNTKIELVNLNMNFLIESLIEIIEVKSFNRGV